MTTEQAKSIKAEYLLKQPPAKVWRAITEAELVSRWLMVTTIKPEVGHRFTFRAQPMPGWDGTVQCEVLEVVPERRLVYSWKGGAGPYLLDTVLTWELEPTSDGGTRLRLEHAGFLPKDQMAFDGMSKGWQGKLGARLDELAASL